MKEGDVIKVHPAHVPFNGEEGIFRDLHSGTNWVGVKVDNDTVRILRSYVQGEDLARRSVRVS